MKKALVASLLGLAVSTAMVTSSFAQGQIIFDNYNSVPYHPVQYSTEPGALLPLGHSAGELVGGTFSVRLFYGIGTIADFSSLIDSGVTVGINPATPGYFQGPGVQIPGYTSGPVTFAILAWDNESGASWAQSLVRNEPVLWQEPSISVVPAAADVFYNLPGPINVAFVPEPSSFALAGLGAAALMIFRRRK